MKHLLLADDRCELPAMLEPILRHWGYRVTVATSAEQTSRLLREGTPDLLLIGAHLLVNPALQLPTPAPALLTFAHPTVAETGADVAAMAVPIDIFELFGHVQASIENPPRQNLRLHLRLPGMYRQGKGQYVVAELLSLSMRGLFFRSPLRVEVGTRLNAVFPLLGHGKELEVAGTVLYTVEPAPYNNYTQGFGLGFAELPPEQQGQLQNYIKESFLSQVATSSRELRVFSPNHSE
jgi:Tfp pilus assembly protein PilZ